MKDFLPDRLNAPLYSDGQVKTCPHCGDVFCRYVVKKSSRTNSITLNGYYCPKCGFAAFNREALNLAIREFGVEDEETKKKAPVKKRSRKVL